MTTYIKSIKRKVWKVVEIKFKVADLENPTVVEEGQEEGEERQDDLQEEEEG